MVIIQMTQINQKKIYEERFRITLNHHKIFGEQLRLIKRYLLDLMEDVNLTEKSIDEVNSVINGISLLRFDLKNMMYYDYKKINDWYDEECCDEQPRLQRKNK